MNTKNNWWGGFLLVALTALTAYLFLRGQSVGALIEILSHMKPHYIALGLALMLCFVGCEALATYSVLGRLGHQIPLKNCLGYSFVGFYFSSITPSATGGQPAQVYCMRKDGVPVAHGTLDMVLISICYQVATLIYALVAWVVMPNLRTGINVVLGLLLLYGGGMMVALTAAMIAMMVYPAPTRQFGNWVLGMLSKWNFIKDQQKSRDTLDQMLAEYGAGAQCIRRHPDLVVRLLGLALLQLTAIYAVPYVVYLAFGLTSASAIEIIFLQALLYLAVSNLPLPGTVGAAEGVFLHAFALYFGANLVTPAMLVSRGISFYAFLLVSGLVALTVHLSIRARDRRRALAALKGKSGRAVRVVAEYLEER